MMIEVTEEEIHAKIEEAINTKKRATFAIVYIVYQILRGCQS